MPYVAVLTPLYRYASARQFALMDPLCSCSCGRPLHDASDQYLLLVREYHRGWRADAVYFCGGRRCKVAYLLVDGDLWPYPRKWVLDLSD